MAKSAATAAATLLMLPRRIPIPFLQTGVKEFYVDAADVAKLAEMNEMTLLEALDEIIDVNEGSDMRADNIVVVMSEGTEMYERNLERNGAA